MADPGTVMPGASLPSAAPPELWGSLLQSFGMLILVLALLMLVLWFIRRVSVKQGAGRQGMIRMLASTYVAPKERVALLEVLGEKLLIGITPQQISFLARIEGDGNSSETVGPEVEKGFFKTLVRHKLKGLAESGDVKGDAHE